MHGAVQPQLHARSCAVTEIYQFEDDWRGAFGDKFKILVNMFLPGCHLLKCRMCSDIRMLSVLVIVLVVHFLHPQLPLKHNNCCHGRCSGLAEAHNY
eukprot:scaffold220385_cov15-Tisochrysis_lutea.AAC.1